MSSYGGVQGSIFHRKTSSTLFQPQILRPLAKTAKFWRCANSAPRRPTEPLPASHHNTSVESKNIFFWILYWSHTKPSGSFPLQETRDDVIIAAYELRSFIWAPLPHCARSFSHVFACSHKGWTRSSAHMGRRNNRRVRIAVFYLGRFP